MDGPLYRGLYEFRSCFKVSLKQNFIDMKDFNCNYNLIYPTFFR